MDTQPPQNFPPDRVVEVDITNSSRSRLTIDQAMAVPEIWCYKRQSLTILRWDAAGYQTAENSEIFPWLSAAMLSEWVEQELQSSNQNVLIKAVRDRVWQCGKHDDPTRVRHNVRNHPPQKAVDIDR